VCTVETKELSLDWWYKDVVDLFVAGQIESELHTLVINLVVGADHEQGSF
jgi:hypothetical protein